MKIEISDLKKCFGENTAVDIPQLGIDNGEIVGLVGNNGAGKTTLFRLMLDLLKADSGTVILEPERSRIDTGDTRIDISAITERINPAESEDWKLLTGAYIDASFLIDFLTAEEFFEFIGRVSGMSKQQTKERLEEFGQFMNGEILGQKKYIRNFSAGNKQKIGIIAALLNRPQLVVLDEPFNFLDPSSQNFLKKLLQKYNEQTGATIIISSHNLQHTIEVSSRIVLLEHGVIVKDLDNIGRKAEAELEDYFNV